jgi:hypothetical protein
VGKITGGDAVRICHTVLVLVGLTAGPLAAGEKEPRYAGKPLSHWVELLRSQIPKERKEAVTALGKIGPPAIPDLLDALRGKDAYVRAGARLALGKMGKDAIPPWPKPSATRTRTSAKALPTRSVASGPRRSPRC